MAKRIARFEVRGNLASGDDGWWSAYDPEQGREVMLRVPSPIRPGGALPRPASHPSLLAPSEWGECDGLPFTVFAGIVATPARARLAAGGPLSGGAALRVLRSLVDALAASPTPDAEWGPLSAADLLLADDGCGRLPEPPTTAPAPDGEAGRLALVGRLLVELLGGGSAGAAVAAGDAATAEIVARLAGDPPGGRYTSLRQLGAAIDLILGEPPAPSEGTAKSGTLDFLLRRMRHSSDFPALSESISAVTRLAGSESESVGQLSALILRDFALTNRILRVVNAAHYRPAGAGTISTISRAIMVIGCEGIRNLAVTLLLFEHLQNKPNAAELGEQVLRASFAGLVAREIAVRSGARDAEQAYICAMFANLGRLLCWYYLPEEAERIRRLVESGDEEESVALRVLGLSLEDLGTGVARSWGFPPVIVASMRRLPPSGALRQPATAEERLRALSAFANEVCEVVAVPAGERQAALERVATRFASLGLHGTGNLRQMVEQSCEEMHEFGAGLHLGVAASAFGQQLRSWRQAAGERDGKEADMEDSLLGEALPAAVLDGGGGTAEAAGPAASPEAILAAGIQEISHSLVEERSLSDILRIVVETMYRAMGFQRVILCIKDARSGTMQGRFGFGADAVDLARRFRFPLAASADVFHGALERGADVLISDTRDPKIRARIPEWYRQAVDAGTFVLLPLAIRGRPVGMVYADRDRAGEIRIGEGELALLRTLRNQALLAIKQAA